LKLFIVRCFKLDPELLNVRVDEHFPLRYPQQEDVASLLRLEIDECLPEPKRLRNALHKIRDRIDAAISQPLVEREEQIGIFESFEDAEKYVIDGVNDWEECGWYNIARIAEYETGLVYAQIPRNTHWYMVRETGQARGYGSPPLIVDKIARPLRLEGYYWHARFETEIAGARNTTLPRL
jgi:hypothetical protein